MDDVGGFADFYVVQTTSPDFSGYDDLSVFVIDGDDVQAQPSLWDALGLRGNQSGPIQVEDIEVPADQIVGPVGDGASDEAVDPWFLIGSSSVWNGIALGTIDIAKRHTTRKRHVDVGMRVADYPTIQDYVGEAVMDTNACRVFVLSVAQAMDRATDDNRRVLEPGETARADYLHWAWQIKFEAAKNVAHVVDKMLHACGGSGYKRDMELERYVRDAKAGWVMGPTNEVLRQFVGKAVLLGFDALDYWNQTYNRRVVENEVKKLDPAEKRELAATLVEQADEAEAKAAAAKAQMAVAARPALLLPGLRPVDRSLETHWVRPGAATAVRLRPDDRLTVLNRDGGQVGELTVIDAEGGEDAAAIGARADADATVLRGLVRDGGADGLLGALHAEGLLPQDARALRLFDDATPRAPRRASTSSAPPPRSSPRRAAGSSTGTGPRRRF